MNNMINDNIKKILADLYVIEPTLKSKESLLIPLIERMIMHRPNVAIDERFVQELRSKLINQSLQMAKPTTYARFFQSKLFYGAVGALALLLIVGPMVSNIGKEASLTFGSHIEDVGEKAFGEMVFGQYGIDGFGGGMGGAPQVDLQARSAKDAVVVNEVASAGGAGGSPAGAGSGVATMTQGVTEPAVLGSDPARSMIYPAPENYKIVFEYTGDDSFEVMETVPVYKRRITSLPASDIASIISNLDIDLINLKQLQNVKVGNISIREDRQFGYNVDLNLTENQIYIYKNWEKWPQMEYKCMAIGCEAGGPRLDPSEVPSDEELFRMADEFLKEYGIDTSMYGEKFVSDQWRRFPMTLAEMGVTDASATQMYIPDEVIVVYQQVLGQMPVYEEAGQPAGLNVSIDIRNKRVAGVNTITPHNYQKSNYPGMTDVKEILDQARKGGRFGYWGYSESKNTKVVKLGSPTIVLMRAWLPQTEPGQSGEMYVPAYRFPVVERPQGVEYVADNILVLAVKGLFVEHPGGVMPMEGTSVEGMLR